MSWAGPLPSGRESGILSGVAACPRVSVGEPFCGAADSSYRRHEGVLRGRSRAVEPADAVERPFAQDDWLQDLVVVMARSYIPDSAMMRAWVPKPGIPYPGMEKPRTTSHTAAIARDGSSSTAALIMSR